MHEPTQKIVGDDGEFHVEDDEVDLSPVTAEGWISLGFFWLLGSTVFYQFVTRYVMNDSAAWTEEIARYMLIATVFVGAAVGVTKNNHIQVDFFYRFMHPTLGRGMAMLVDGVRILFFAATVYLTWLMMQKMDSYKMTIIDLPMNIVYGICLFGFAAMLFRSLQVARIHMQRGYTVLERPESTMDDK
jgi:TRAP-type C4-dicarboxylate transport system permease small subunit